MTNPEELYCDGGLIGPNPSLIGGTWCWVWINNGEYLRHSSGIITPEDFEMSVISNNVSELIAALRALKSTPKGWNGTLCSDSQVTLRRLTGNPKFTNTPRWLIDRVLAVRRTRKFKTKLIAGHPTIKELKQGFADRNGLPTSKWNVFCDQECCRLAAKFKEMLHDRT